MQQISKLKYMQSHICFNFLYHLIVRLHQNFSILFWKYSSAWNLSVLTSEKLLMWPGVSLWAPANQRTDGLHRIGWSSRDVSPWPVAIPWPAPRRARSSDAEDKWIVPKLLFSRFCVVILSVKTSSDIGASQFCAFAGCTMRQDLRGSSSPSPLETTWRNPVSESGADSTRHADCFQWSALCCLFVCRYFP